MSLREVAYLSPLTLPPKLGYSDACDLGFRAKPLTFLRVWCLLDHCYRHLTTCVAAGLGDQVNTAQSYPPPISVQLLTSSVGGCQHPLVTVSTHGCPNSFAAAGKPRPTDLRPWPPICPDSLSS